MVIKSTIAIKDAIEIVINDHVCILEQGGVDEV